MAWDVYIEFYFEMLPDGPDGQEANIVSRSIRWTRTEAPEPEMASSSEACR